jgi:hypothetical protein
MSAAATAAGYLYASGRLRGRQSKDHDESHKQPEAPKPRREVRVAALPSPDDSRTPDDSRKPRRQPTVQYRTRRWRPDEPGKPE